jgi:gas vesicle structural protein
MQPEVYTSGADLKVQDAALVDILDRLLETGVVLNADLTLTLAGVDLVYICLKALICSADRAEALGAAPQGLLT